ncbi:MULTISPECIES: DUF6098 family protein [Streptomyces]|uniref:Uncharacterized protein n=2 Tax=Streptomyces TaxID=1883 RepID=A0A100Y3H8_9ACTN|nr:MULTISPECIES: DUF6098 family protein [Streptomyces]KUH36945.1 hypothetical protein ATE80_20740 [Streptomyces kanasensis]UUS34342.1 DUF6098 family protein [Streptomyces changanensis]
MEETATPSPVTAAPDGLTELPNLSSLTELAGLLERHGSLYVRWSRGPAEDMRSSRSVDHLTGITMPGLSANPLAVEAWWGDRAVRLWVARRLYDYCHLRQERNGDVRPWALRGREVGRGPDNEPLVRDVEPVCWIDLAVIEEAQEEVAAQRRPWGPMRREP